MRVFATAVAIAMACSASAAQAQQGSSALRAYQPAITASSTPRSARPADEARSVVVALRSMPARHVVGPGDVQLSARRAREGLPAVTLAIGRETTAPISAGQALRADLLAAPTVIDRNDRVVLLYRSGALTIRAEGRALERASVGKRLAAMNLASRQTVLGTAVRPGLVEVAR